MKLIKRDRLNSKAYFIVPIKIIQIKIKVFLVGRKLIMIFVKWMI